MLMILIFRVSDFVINCFWNCQELEEKQKSMILGQLIHIQIFQTFGNLELDFDIY